MKDVMKLTGTLTIPLLPKDESKVVYINQVVSYSRLPGQCNRCCKFSHPTPKCPLLVNNTNAERKGMITAVEKGEQKQQGDEFTLVKSKRMKNNAAIQVALQVMK